jgi:dipeptidyl aminopeptidase/acylaminoacyl peptidase
VTSVVYSPDGSRILESFDDFSVGTRDASTGAVIRTAPAHENFITSAVYSPDATRILTASVDKTVRIWDAATLTQLAVLPHRDLVNNAAYSPDGALIVAGSNDSFAHVWDARTGVEARVLAGHHAPVRCIAFSPDGKQVATGSLDRTVRIWETRTGIPLAVLSGHQATVFALSYSHDGRWLASAAADGTARIWDARIPADWRSQVMWEEAVETNALSDVQKTVLGIPSALTFLTNAALKAGSDGAVAHDVHMSQDPRVLGRLAESTERKALTEPAEKADATLLEAFTLYTRAAEQARKEQWPDSQWLAWRYRRSSLARVLAADGLMQEVARAYERAIAPQVP